MPFSSGDIDGDSDEQAKYDENDDAEDDVHPSVAWLYPSSTTPPPLGGSTASRKKSRRTLCVDYGTRRVGLAIGIGISPRVVPGVTNRGNELEVVRQVLIRARGEGIRDIVVGLPLERQVCIYARKTHEITRQGSTRTAVSEVSDIRSDPIRSDKYRIVYWISFF